MLIYIKLVTLLTLCPVVLIRGQPFPMPFMSGHFNMGPHHYYRAVQPGFPPFGMSPSTPGSTGSHFPTIPGGTCSYNGRVYRNHQRFVDGCNNCHCALGGVTCSTNACSSSPARTRLPPYTCKWRDQHYRDHENFPAGDGCNTCNCRDGTVCCTAMLVCPPTGDATTEPL